jgi:hypothetical protein
VSFSTLNTSHSALSQIFDPTADSRPSTSLQEFDDIIDRLSTQDCDLRRFLRYVIIVALIHPHQGTSVRQLAPGADHRVLTRVHLSLHCQTWLTIRSCTYMYVFYNHTCNSDSESKDLEDVSSRSAAHVTVDSADLLSAATREISISNIQT